MLDQFFQIGPIPADRIIGTYQIPLVILSYIIGTMASYVALDITGRIRDVSISKRASFLWLIGGAFAMGVGIWSMHFIGMLAFIMPMQMTYDPFLTILSMVVAILASTIAFSILRTKKFNLLAFIIGGIVLGLAIASMHYIGMAAMTEHMQIRYLPSIFFLSILIAILASEAALYLSMISNRRSVQYKFLLKTGSALIMGAAICGMHYTGMAAAIFTHEKGSHLNVLGPDVNPEMLSVMIALATILILAIAIGVSSFKEAINTKIVAMARQSGMAEVASHVLHNVGNVLNSVNTSRSLIQKHIDEIDITKLQKIHALIEQHQNDLGSFFTEDPKGIRIPNYLNNLSKEWLHVKSYISEELKRLDSNINHIKSLVTTQQSMHGIMNFAQPNHIEKIIDEALLLTGINFINHKIILIKEFGNVGVCQVDKLKLTQILVNLIHNAKESILEKNPDEKSIKLKTFQDNHMIMIQITDNGMGFDKALHDKIFSYGFTTKHNGHGFGLHASVILAHEMKGSLTATSRGKGQGAIFTIKLPVMMDAALNT